MDQGRILEIGTPAELVAAHGRAQGLDDEAMRRVTLEDVFLELTGREYRG